MHGANVLWETGDYANRKELVAASNMIEAALLRHLGGYETGPVHKVVNISFDGLIPLDRRGSDRAPTGNDVDELP